MASDPAKSGPPRKARAIVQRTRGRTHGPVTRLMSPSDWGEILKPFVFLDLFDHDGAPFSAGLHPHSGIATLTYIAEGAVSFIDPDNVRGTLAAGGVEQVGLDDLDSPIGECLCRIAEGVATGDTNRKFARCEQRVDHPAPLSPDATDYGDHLLAHVKSYLVKFKSES